MIRSSVNRDDVDMGSGNSAYAGALIHVDTNKLFGLDLVKQHGFATDNPDFQMLQSGRTLFWSVAAQDLPEGRVVYVLDLDEVKTASNTASCEVYLSWGFAPDASAGCGCVSIPSRGVPEVCGRRWTPCLPRRRAK